MWHVTHDMWHVTCDTWHVTRDKWDVTHDTWHVKCDMFGEVNIPSKFQLPSSYCLWFMIIWRSGRKGWLTELINEWMNDEAVYRTAPATPGLLEISSTGWFFTYSFWRLNKSKIAKKYWNSYIEQIKVKIGKMFLNFRNKKNQSVPNPCSESWKSSNICEKVLIMAQWSVEKVFTKFRKSS